jgi:hypothetical protein
MGVCPSGSVRGIPSRRMRMLRAPNCERAPNPRTDTRVSCAGFVRLATVTPGNSESVCSTKVCGCPGTRLFGRTVLIANGRSSGDRPTSRVTVTTGGSRVARVSCASAEVEKPSAATLYAMELYAIERKDATTIPWTPVSGFAESTPRAGFTPCWGPLDPLRRPSRGSQQHLRHARESWPAPRHVPLRTLPAPDDHGHVGRPQKC